MRPADGGNAIGIGDRRTVLSSGLSSFSLLLLLLLLL